MRELNNLIDWLIPNQLKDSTILFRKARIITFIHLFLFVVIFVLGILSLTVHPENDIPLLPSLVILSFFMYAFKKWGNLALSGNFLAVGWMVVLLPSVFETGGLYSDNLL